MSRKRILRWWYKRIADELRDSQVNIMEKLKETEKKKQAQKAKEERKERRPKIRVLNREDDPHSQVMSRSETSSVSNNWSESRIADDLVAELEHELE